MKSKFATIATVLLMFSVSFGQISLPDPQEPKEVWLSADLGISHCRREGATEWCTLSGIRFGRDKIVLYPRDSSSYRGFWSQVKMADMVRYIGIVTVFNYETIEFPPELPPQTPTASDPIITQQYTIIVEIIGDEGVVAKMSMDTHDMSAISSVTLVGPEVRQGFDSYIPRFRVGPSRGWPIPVPPCEPDSEGDCTVKFPRPEEPTSLRANQPEWTVQMGSMELSN